jgi:hypothetical protein
MTATHDTTTTEATSKRTRPIDIYAAPDCDIDLLSEVPCVTLGANGKHQIALVNPDGTIDDEAVTEVEDMTMIPRCDLCVVRTRSNVFLMRTSNYEANVPIRTREEIERQDIKGWVESTIYGLIEGISQVGLSGSADLYWHAGVKLVENGGPGSPKERLGFLMMLDALIAAPEAVQEALQVLRKDYVALHPELALTR